MKKSPDDLPKILAAIELVRERTGTEIIMTVNETVRDGSCVMLKSPEGWFIEVRGGPLLEECEYPSLGLKLQGFIYNPKRDILEALTLHPAVEAHESVAELDIMDSRFDFANWVATRMVPNVRHSTQLVLNNWATENARQALTEKLQSAFDMTSPKKRFVRGPHTVDITVEPALVDWPKLGLTVRADGLSIEQLEAILKILDKPVPTSTAS